MFCSDFKQLASARAAGASDVEDEYEDDEHEEEHTDEDGQHAGGETDEEQDEDHRGLFLRSVVFP